MVDWQSTQPHPDGEETTFLCGTLAEADAFMAGMAFANDSDLSAVLRMEARSGIVQWLFGSQLFVDVVDSKGE